MRLIDADALSRHGNRGGIVQWYDIEKAPTVDAVPVVRCKDCKHHGKSSGEYCLKDGCYGWFDNDYCSRAERKEE